MSITKCQIILDANVLIDYANNIEILKLIGCDFPRICIPRPIFEEVKEIDETIYQYSNIIILDVDTKDLLEAEKNCHLRRIWRAGAVGAKNFSPLRVG